MQQEQDKQYDLLIEQALYFDDRANFFMSLTMLNKAIELNPHDYFAHFLKGRGFLTTRLFLRAKMEFEIILLQCKNLTDTLRVMIQAYILYAQEKYDQANAAFDQVLQLEPNNYFALFGLASVLYESKQYAEALPFAQRAVENAYYSKRRGLNLVGQVFEEMGKRKEAMEHYREAIADGGEASSASFNLARLLEIEGKPEEAIEWYKRLRIYDPGRACANLALVYMNQKTKMYLALEYLNLAITYEPLRLASHLTKAKYYYMMFGYSTNLNERRQYAQACIHACTYALKYLHHYDNVCRMNRNCKTLKEYYAKHGILVTDEFENVEFSDTFANMKYKQIMYSTMVQKKHCDCLIFT